MKDNAFTVENLSKALFVVNKHAKTAIDPKFLYELKKKAIVKLLAEGKAKKIGLHFSKNPKLSKQTSTVLITCGDYLFHQLPSKEDFQNLPHLGDLDDQHRNPKTHVSLKQAKALLVAYTGLKPPQPTNPYAPNTKKQSFSPFAKRFGER
ncbi:YkyB-like protein [Ureibacillus xyleni]|uniref:YkyB-like protein n=1 Tax=Ureibacillus xyleni TaxID=614648 RepID=A0A285T458_9BACL|nr:YkyB family protein [Ureibacillus xyleni]SOC15560.1 YkyB-like protein [Ureibacillus xyleni]